MCEAIFGIDTLAGWMNVSPYKVRQLIQAGLPCSKIEFENSTSQWVFSTRAINDWFYQKTRDDRKKDPSLAE